MLDHRRESVAPGFSGNTHSRVCHNRRQLLQGKGFGHQGAVPVFKIIHGVSLPDICLLLVGCKAAGSRARINSPFRRLGVLFSGSAFNAPLV